MKLNQNENHSYSKSTPSIRSTISRYSDDEIPESPETSPDEEFGSRKRMEDVS